MQNSITSQSPTPVTVSSADQTSPADLSGAVDTSPAVSSDSNQQKENFNLTDEVSLETEKLGVEVSEASSEPFRTKTQEFLKEEQKPKQISEGSSVVSSSTEGALLGYIAISLQIQEILRALGYPETSIKSILSCGEKMGIKILIQCGCEIRFIDALKSCNLRICKRCSEKRKRRIFNDYLPVLNSLTYQRGRFEFFFATFSPLNYSDCKDGLDEIIKRFNNLMNTTYMKLRVLGYLAVIETTEDGKGFHHHIHAIFYGKRLDNLIKGRCFDCKRKKTILKFDKDTEKYYCAIKNCKSFNVKKQGDSKLVKLASKIFKRPCNVHITDKCKTKSGNLIPLSKTPFLALSYMLKYISTDKTKFSSDNNLAVYIVSIRKRRLLMSGGLLYDNKPVKQKPICFKCGEVMHITFDFELSILFNAIERGEPPPKVGRPCFPSLEPKKNKPY